MERGGRESGSADFATLLEKAVGHRRGLLHEAGASDACRVFSGAADGVDGVFIDRYGAGATLIVYEGRAPQWFDAQEIGPVVLGVLKAWGVQGVYHKPFARDRSKMGGELPPVVTDPRPLCGEGVEEALAIREHDYRLEVRLYDGLSTGIFLDQRENRKWVQEGVKARVQRGAAPKVLNTFAYTCAFSVAAARAGALTTSVDVSARYLEWGKRNFALNGIHAEGVAHRFARMDTFEFLEYAARKGLRYDLVILDPPSFSAGSKKKGIRPWSSVSDYPDLIRAARKVLEPKGSVFASTNTTELCRPGRLQQLVVKALGNEPRWLTLPDAPVDFSRDRDRFAAVGFTV
ncbi:MAG: class I SAM-dependent methyltransferase [Planctomycetes bacterium]|nr:class I SAM-dependent methyltransferase [Planctomycetota bacterium]